MNKTKELDLILQEVDAIYPVSKSRIALQGLFIDIAIAITKMRNYRNLSQRDLAKRLSTAQSTIARWETPGYKSYTLTKLHEIADCLDYDIELAFKEKNSVETKTISHTWRQATTGHYLKNKTSIQPVNKWQPEIIAQEVAL